MPKALFFLLKTDIAWCLQKLGIILEQSTFTFCSIMVINTIIHRDSSELKVHRAANHKIYHYCTVAPKIFLRSCAPKLLKASDFLVNVISMLIIFQSFQSIVIFSNICSRCVWQLSAWVLEYLVDLSFDSRVTVYNYLRQNKYKYNITFQL